LDPDDKGAHSKHKLGKNECNEKKKRKSTENEAEVDVEVLEVNDDGSDENCRAAILEADRYDKDKNENENLNLSIAELYFDMIAKYAYK